MKTVEDLFSEFSKQTCSSCGTQRCDGSPEWRLGCPEWREFCKSRLPWPGEETVLHIFHEFEKHGLLRDDLCFDPEHFISTTLKEHWNDGNN